MGYEIYTMCKELSGMFKDIKGEISNLDLSSIINNSEEREEEEEYDETSEEKREKIEEELKNMSLSSAYDYLQKLKNNNENDKELVRLSELYYIKKLKNEYEKRGDRTAAELANQYLLDIENKKEVFLENFYENLYKLQYSEVKRKYKSKKVNIIDESEYKELLTGEDDGGPMWVAIWADFIKFIRDGFASPPSLTLFNKACHDALDGKVKEIIKKYSPTEVAIAKQNKKVQSAQKIIESNDLSSYKSPDEDDFENVKGIENVALTSNSYKFNLLKVSNSQIEAKKRENREQKTKLFTWIEILDLFHKQRFINT